MPRASRFLLAVLVALTATGSFTFRPAPATAAGSGSVSLTTIGGVYNQQFDTLANTAGTAHNTLPTGWFLSEVGTSSLVNDAYAVSDGTLFSGDVYSFGAAASSDRAFGTLRSGSNNPTIGASFTNNTGATITSLDIGFVGEMWRAGVTARLAADRLDFEYSTDATSLTTGSWTSHDGLDYLSTNLNATAGPLDGNLSANKAAVFSQVTGLSIANGASFWIRWTDSDIASSDDGLSIDQFALTPQSSVTPNLSINDVSMNEGNAGTTTFGFNVSLTSPAGAGGVTFDIGTADGTATSGSGDYVAHSLTGQTIPEGLSSFAFDVTVNGDTTGEPDETFFANVTNVVGASVTDGQGLGTIRNDDSQCDLPFTPIYEIQGSGTTGLLGTRTTEGVVVADLEGGSTSWQGFFIQDPAGDGNVATSDGIFVFTGSGANKVNLGDQVHVTGFVREQNGQTAIHGADSSTAPTTLIEVCGSGSVAPTDVTMPFATTSSFLERYEGMLIRLPQSLVIAEYFNYERFGEMVLALPLDGETRPFTGTAVDEPGAAANARTAANALRRITLDDGLSAQNPNTVRHPNGGSFALDNLFRGGDRVANATGVLSGNFSYRIQPTAPANYTATNPRPTGTTAPDTHGRVTVAAMNTLNFFLTPDIDGSPPVTVPGVTDNSCGGNANLECRGWDSSQPLEFDRQRTKLLQALLGLDADVLGLNEIENTPGVDPSQHIADGLNALIPGEDVVYARIDTGVIGTDAIRVGLIYKPGVVTPIGSFQTLDHLDNPLFDDTRSRPALAQTFMENATGEKFTVIVNHLKSKSDSGLAASCPTTPVPDCDQLDGQSFWNHTRTRAAQALVEWVDSDPTGSGDPDFLIIGDLNSYAKEDPIDTIKAGLDATAGTTDDWTNLIETHVGPYAYSFVFDGQAGYLDHALSNASLTGQVTGADEWHINADEPDFLDYDTSFKPPAQEAIFEPNQFRTSDHDPVLVGLDLDSAPTIAVAGGGVCGMATSTVLVTVDDLVTAPGDLVLGLTGSSNAGLVPTAGVAITSDSGTGRSIHVTPVPKASGTAVLSFELTDGTFTVPFTLTVKVGTDGNDTLTGTAGADLLLGLQGNDTLTGLGDGDLLCGGNGSDSLGGGDGVDTLDGERGADVVSGGADNDVLRGGMGDDLLNGGAGADDFSGGMGADTNVDFNAGEGDTSDGT